MWTPYDMPSQCCPCTAQVRLSWCFKQTYNTHRDKQHTHRHTLTNTHKHTQTGMCTECTDQLREERGLPGLLGVALILVQAVLQLQGQRVVAPLYHLQHLQPQHRMLEMMSDALTNVEKHVTSQVAFAHGQGYTKDSVFWLAQITLCIMMSSNFSPFLGANFVSDALTNRLLIRQYYSLQTIVYITYTNLSLCCYCSRNMAK